MDNKKSSQQGNNPQHEQKKPNPEQGKPLTETKPFGDNVGQKEEIKVVETLAKEMTPADKDALIKDLTAKLAAQMAANPMPDAKKIATEAIQKVHEARARQEAERQLNPSPATGTTPGGKTDRWPDRQKKSRISNPVQFVWALAEEMIKADPTARRKDIINAAIDAGVAGYTARTQYQAWYTAQRETQRQAAKRDAETAQKLQQTGSSRA